MPIDLFVAETFVGINNVDDPTTLSPTFITSAGKTEGVVNLSEASNVFIDNQGKIRRREGYVRLGSGSYTSLWSNMSQTLCYGCKGRVLYKIIFDGSNFSEVSLLSGLDINNKVVFAESSDRIFFTDGIHIGQIRLDVATIFDIDNINFKEEIPAGYCIEYYRNRIYVAMDEAIYFSDPLTFHTMDIRFNIIPFTNKITLMKAVSDGMYISSGSTYFMQFTDINTSNLIWLNDDTAIPDSGICIAASNILKGEHNGKSVMWLGKKGYYIGMESGKIVHISNNKYALPISNPSGSSGAIFNDIGHTKQYISVIY